MNKSNILKNVLLAFLAVVFSLTINNGPKFGDTLDSLNGVSVYYNGSKIKHNKGRNKANDGYNFGLKWQCVEFTKRYYYEHLGHKMPNTYGHAKDFFNKNLGDVAFNPKRGLMQYKNVRYEKPQVNDLLIYDAYPGNPYGHMGIIAEVGPDYIILLQQNVGTKTRQRLKLAEYNGLYTIADFDVLGWLRK